MDSTLKNFRVAKIGKQRAIGNSVVVCVCVFMRACARACLCVFACVRRFVSVYQCVALPCTDQKRGPTSRLPLNLIPGHHFTMFSTSLYSDVRTKEARKEFANSL